MTDSLSSVIN